MVKLANEENLKKGAPFRFRTGEQQVETARRGGIASGEARRRKKTMKETAKMLLDMEIPDAAKELKAKLKVMGISPAFTFVSDSISFTQAALHSRHADKSATALVCWRKRLLLMEI